MRKPEHPAHDMQDTVGAAAARARVWASPGVRSAVGWAVTALEEGVESASPKVRKTLQRIARDLAQTVESTSPDLQRGLERISPALGRAVDLKRAGKTAAEASRRAARRIEHPKHGMRTPTKAWLIAGVLAGSALVGATLGRLPRRPGTPAGRLGAEAESKARNARARLQDTAARSRPRPPGPSQRSNPKPPDSLPTSKTRLAPK